MVVVLILGGVIAVLALNLNLKGPKSVRFGAAAARSASIDRSVADDTGSGTGLCASRPAFASIRSATRSKKTRC